MSGERPFLDTNVLLYAFNTGDPRKAMAAGLIRPGAVISVQVLNEFVAAARKLRLDWFRVLALLDTLRLAFPAPLPITVATHGAALRVCAKYGYHIYDSLIIASALEAGCDTLYSEDMQDGQAIEGLTIRNPFH